MSTTIPSPMIHKYLHFARHSLTTPLPHHSTASLSAFFAALHPLRNSSVTLLAFFAAKHLPSEPSGDTFALFCRPKPPVGTLRRHFCLFFAARNLTSEPFSDTLDHFCHLASMQPIFPDSTVDSSIVPKTTFY